MKQYVLDKPERRVGDFWIFWTGQTISQIGSALTSFALPLLVYNLTGSALTVGLTFAATYLPYVLFGLLGGAWVDRVNRKTLMISLDIARTLLLALVPLLTNGISNFVWWIFAISFINATLSIIFSTASTVAIANLVRPDELVKANGRILTGNYIGYIVGPLLASLILAHWSLQVVLWCDALTFLVSAGSLALTRSSFNGNPVEEQREARLGFAILEGVRYVFSQPVVYLLGLLTLLVNFAMAPLGAQLVVFAKQVIAASDSQVAAFATALGVGGVVATLTAGPLKRRVPYNIFLLGSVILFGVLTIVFALVHNYLVDLVLWGCIYGLVALFNVAFFSILQGLVPDRLRGRVIQNTQMLAALVVPLSTVLSGIVIDQIKNVVLIYSVLGAFILLVALAFLFSPLAHVERYLPEELFSPSKEPVAAEELIASMPPLTTLEP